MQIEGQMNEFAFESNVRLFQTSAELRKTEQDNVCFQMDELILSMTSVFEEHMLSQHG